MDSIYNFIMNLIGDLGSASLIFNCLLILIESILPPLPLSLFITILFINYGPILGFFISWIFTVIGSIISFYLFQSVFKKLVDKYVRKNNLANKFLMLMDNIKFSNLVLIIAIPFSPAFIINIVAGISKMEIKKFIPAIIIGKISLVVFWGYVGTTLIESLTNPIQLIKVVVIVLIVYIISKIVNKKLNLD